MNQLMNGELAEATGVHVGAKVVKLVRPLLVNETVARREVLGGLSTRTMHRLRSSGRLPFMKVGKRTMYRMSDLEAWVAQHRSVAG